MDYSIMNGAKLFDQDAEMAVLGCFLEYEHTTEHIHELTENDFYVQGNRRIFTAMQGLYCEKMKIDLITTHDKLRELGIQEDLTEALLGCIKLAFTSVSIKQHIAILKKASARRTAIDVLQRSANDLLDFTNDTTTIIEHTRNSLRNLAYTGNSSWTTMADIMVKTFGKIEERCRGEEKRITSGTASIDNAIGGFYPGELTIVGARPAIGKSAFGASVAIGAAKQGIKVCYASREMSDEQVGQRVISHFSGVDGMKLRKGTVEDEDWKQIWLAVRDAGNLPIHFTDSLSAIEDLRAEVQHKVDEGECELLIVDYMQIMRTKKKFEADHLRVAYISKILKDMTLDLRIPVIALAQVKRFAGGGRAKMPTLEDLKDSGAIEQDADGVIFLHRPDDAEDAYVDKRDRELFEALQDTGKQYMAFGIAKQRQGATGYTTAVFDPSLMRYTAIDRR